MSFADLPSVLCHLSFLPSLLTSHFLLLSLTLSLPLPPFAFSLPLFPCCPLPSFLSLSASSLSPSPLLSCTHASFLADSLEAKLQSPTILNKEQMFWSKGGGVRKGHPGLNNRGEVASCGLLGYRMGSEAQGPHLSIYLKICHQPDPRYMNMRVCNDQQNQTQSACLSQQNWYH